MLYDMLNDENMLEQRTPILVACNKQDLQFARRATQIQTDVERELEELRKVRRATQDDQDTAKEQVSKAGFLEQLSGRLSFNEASLRAKLPPISFVECSIKKDDLEAVYKFIKEL